MRARIKKAMIEITIRILHTSLIKQNFSFVLSYADETRKEKAERFKNEKDQLLSLGAAYLMKKYLPNEEIKITDTGKPYLPNGPFFNVSHSGEYVVFASLSNSEVGIDIEKIDENKLDGIRYVLDEEEKKINDSGVLFQIWSNKESLIKCSSNGLKDIKKVKGLPLNGKRIINGQSYYTKSVIYNGYSLSVTLKQEEPFNLIIENINSLEEQ
jgi:4'-phosphopantetheinyl transferase